MKISSAVISKGSGSVGGLTLSRNKGGMYFRKRAMPVNPNTERQQLVRQALGQLAIGWNNLDATEREGWNQYAANVAMTDKLGETMYLSGQQHFIRSNAARVQAGLAIIESAPAVFNLGDSGTLGNAGIDTATEELTVSFAGGDDWKTTVGSSLLVYVGRPQNPGVSYFKGPFRYLGRVNGAVVAPTSPAAISIATSGLVFTAGQVVWIKAVLTQADGRLTNGTILGPAEVT